MGFGGGQVLGSSAPYEGEGSPQTKPIWLTNVGCRGGEQRIEQCNHPDWGVTNCKHAKDVAMRCT